jgi:hypothetical protein
MPACRTQLKAVGVLQNTDGFADPTDKFTVFYFSLTRTRI